MTMTETSPSLTDTWFSVVSTKTAVLPMPDLAWHSTSMPSRQLGMASCCTSDGCSNPKSTMARSSSGLSIKSRNDDECTPTKWPLQQQQQQQQQQQINGSSSARAARTRAEGEGG